MARRVSGVLVLVMASVLGLTARAAQAQPLYGATSTFGVCPSNLYRINPVTGAATLIGPIVGRGATPSSTKQYCLASAMTFDKFSGLLYAIVADPTASTIGTLVAIDTTTAAATEIAPSEIFATDMSIRSDGTLYAHGGSEADLVPHNVFTVDKATGASTFLGITGELAGGNGLAFSPGDVLYHASGNRLNTIDQTTGDATHVTNLTFPVACSTGARRISAMDFQPFSGTLFGVLNCDNASWHLVKINTTSGIITDVGQTADTIDALAFQPDGFSPARLWVGLKNSDDVGLRLDLKAEIFLGTELVAIGEAANVKSGSSGFNNAILNTLALIPVVPTTVSTAGPSGLFDPYQLRVSVRRTCSGGGHTSGTARLWYNGRPIDTGAARDAGSRFDVTRSGNNTVEYLRTGFNLSPTAGTAKAFIDKFVNSSAPCPSRPFVSFGTWAGTP